MVVGLVVTGLVVVRLVGLVAGVADDDRDWIVITGLASLPGRRRLGAPLVLFTWASV